MVPERRGGAGSPYLLCPPKCARAQGFGLLADAKGVFPDGAGLGEKGSVGHWRPPWLFELLDNSSDPQSHGRGTGALTL